MSTSCSNSRTVNSSAGIFTTTIVLQHTSYQSMPNVVSISALILANQNNLMEHDRQTNINSRKGQIQNIAPTNCIHDFLLTLTNFATIYPHHHHILLPSSPYIHINIIPLAHTTSTFFLIM